MGSFLGFLGVVSDTFSSKVLSITYLGFSLASIPFLAYLANFSNSDFVINNP
jgi:hypothetical protein